MRRSFPYSRRSFVQNLVFIGAAIPLTLALFLISGVDIVFVAIVLSLEAAAFIVLGVSPLLTAHEVGDGEVVLRQGWYFRARVPIKDIRKVGRVERGPARTGVFFRLLASTLYVTSRRTDLVELELRQKKAFGWALGKKADRVVFDVEDTSALLAALEGDLLSPVQA